VSEPAAPTDRAAPPDGARAVEVAEPPAAVEPLEPPCQRTRRVLDDHPPVTGERRLFNRELSWLGFNERVLALAGRPDVPVLERAKFLAIFTSNLDEFFQVRVAGLMEQVAAGLTRETPDGMRPTEQLDVVRDYVRELVAEQSRLFHEEVVPNLAAEGIRFSNWSSLDDDDREWLVGEFEETVFPVLTPLAVDPAHPFPYISNLSLNLAVVVRDPADGETRFARVKVPPILPRFVVMPDGERFVPLEQVIAAHLDRLFPGLEVLEHHAFRVTRNADFEVEEDEADDLMLAIESELNRRRFGRVVRLEIEPDMPDTVLDLLTRELDIDDDRVYRAAGPLGLDGLWALFDVDRADLKYETFVPVVPHRLTTLSGDEADVFTALRRGDVLVQHPYDSFGASVQHFIDTAARDPNVLAIKITLYRTSGPGSPLVRSLVKAAEEGKQVVALVELKARFDEEANIEWARVLEEVGVHVAYGVVGLKTHTKIALVVRKEGDRVRRYCHIGTGNYNDKTARIYEDLGLLTADPALGSDLTDLFNVLTGYGRQGAYRKLLTAPTTFRPRILDYIRRETEADDGHIVMKMNSLVDEEMVDALYDASRTGTPVDLIVRGICCLRPGVPGQSENVRVRSVVGRYLEHSRIFRFGSPARGVDYLIGSGDLMPRNLNRRVEAIAPVEGRELHARLDEILDTLLDDDVLAWELGPDGAWVRVPVRDGLDTHEHLQQLALQRA
jgi:polyphosphate kinase